MRSLFFRSSFPFSPNKIPIFYGYIIVLISILAAIITAPGQTIGVSVFTDYFINFFHLSRSQLSIAYMIGTIGSATIIGRAGVLIDKLGCRLIGFWAIISLGLTLIVFSQLAKFYSLFSITYVHKYNIIIFLLITLVFFALRFLAQGVISLVSRTMLLKWFVSLRGRMTSILGIFTTLSMSASPPVFNWLIMQYGWRGTYLILGLTIGTVSALIFWFFARSTPEECGLIPDGHKHKVAANKVPIKEHNWTLKEAKSTYTFWVFNLSLSIFSLLITAFAFHVTSIFKHAELARHDAVTIFFPIACVAIVVKLISGWLCDIEPWKSKLKYQLFIFLLTLGLFCLGALLLKNILGRDLIIVGAGIATGLSVTLSAVCWPQFYGRRYLGSISGSNAAYLIFSSAIGPLLFAISVKLTNSYTSAILVCLAIIITLLCLSLRADQPQKAKT